MSDKSVAGTYGVIGERLAHDHPECAGFSFSTDAKEGCDEWAYPAIVSHAHFRGQAWHGDAYFPPAEYDISDRNIDLVRRTGGVLGPFIAETRISTTGLAFPADCGLSSEFFGYSFDFARTRMGIGSNRVGMATDFTLIPGTAPRFGKNACWGYHTAENPKAERRAHPERYNARGQVNGVVYENRKGQHNVKLGTNAPLTPDRLGKRVFDVNVDGLAHFGMVPDVLQDLKNLGWPDEDRQAMFASAEGYIEMWEKSQRLATYPSR
jgi:microsomal dipeptidase-like Zn-dependent dipeptidase